MRRAPSRPAREGNRSCCFRPCLTWYSTCCWPSATGLRTATRLARTRGPVRRPARPHHGRAVSGTSPPHRRGGSAAGLWPERCRSAPQVFRADQGRTPGGRGARSRTPRRARARGATAQAVSAAGVGMWIYRWLLRLSPESLRHEYGAAMEEMFARRMAEAAANGRWRPTYVWLRELAACSLSPSRNDSVGSADAPPSATTTLSARKQESWTHCAGDPARRTTTHSHAALHRGGRADAGPGHWRQRLALHRRAPRRAQPAALSRLGTADRSGLRRSGRNIPSGLHSMAWQLYFQLADHARTLEAWRSTTPAAMTLTGRGEPERIMSRARRHRSRRSCACRRRSADGSPKPKARRARRRSPCCRMASGCVDSAAIPPSSAARSRSTASQPRWSASCRPHSPSPMRGAMSGWPRNRRERRRRSSSPHRRGSVARRRDRRERPRGDHRAHRRISLASCSEPARHGLAPRCRSRKRVIGRIARHAVDPARIRRPRAARGVRERREPVPRALRERGSARWRSAGRSARAAAASPRYFLAESVLLAAVGGALGLGARVGRRSTARRVRPRQSAAAQRSPHRRRRARVHVRAEPAFAAWRSASFRSCASRRSPPTLHEQRARPDRDAAASHRARQLLMGGQVALALVLLVASGLMVRSFQKLRAVDPGFDPSSTLTFSIGLPERDYPSRAALPRRAHYAFSIGCQRFLASPPRRPPAACRSRDSASATG